MGSYLIYKLTINKNVSFLILLILRRIIIITRNIWISIWIYLEINLISFIFLIINYKNYFSIESRIFYFIAQTIASIIFLISIIFSLFYNLFFFFVLLSIIIKIGMAPLHFWVIIIIDKLSWILIYLLLTWQKLGPLILLFKYNNINNNTIFIFIIFSIFIGSLMGLNYSSLKKILAYSSINQLRWISISLIIFNKIFKIYFIIYIYLILINIIYFIYNNLNFIFQLINFKNIKLNIIIFLNLISLGGLPPFLGFFPKLIIIKLINNSIIIILIIFFTLISLFYYLRIILSRIILNSIKLYILTIKKNKNLIYITNIRIIRNLTLILFFILY